MLFKIINDGKRNAATNPPAEKAPHNNVLNVHR